MLKTIADLHTHTVFSDGRLSPQEVLRIAADKGYRVGLADHCGPGNFQLDSRDRFEKYLSAIQDLPVYRAVELDLGREIPISPEELKRCHYLIGGVHSVGTADFFDPRITEIDLPLLLDEMLEIIGLQSQKYSFDILAHPGLLPCNFREQKDAITGGWRVKLVELALKCNLAIELSSRWLVPDLKLASMAKEAGLKFSLGSDGHGADKMCRLDYSLELAGKLELADRDLFWPLNGAIPWQTNPGSGHPSP
jgi:histidinol phosphatase-like PHP family hydrolase